MSAAKRLAAWLRGLWLRLRRRDAWDRLEEALLVLAALDDQSVHWSEVFDYADLPPGPDAQTAAVELAERLAIEARLELLAGAR